MLDEATSALDTESEKVCPILMLNSFDDGDNFVVGCSSCFG